MGGLSISILAIVGTFQAFMNHYTYYLYFLGRLYYVRDKDEEVSEEQDQSRVKKKDAGKYPKKPIQSQE